MASITAKNSGSLILSTTDASVLLYPNFVSPAAILTERTGARKADSRVKPVAAAVDISLPVNGFTNFPVFSLYNISCVPSTAPILRAYIPCIPTAVLIGWLVFLIILSFKNFHLVKGTRRLNAPKPATSFPSSSALSAFDNSARLILPSW